MNYPKIAFWKSTYKYMEITVQFKKDLENEKSKLLTQTPDHKYKIFQESQ